MPVNVNDKIRKLRPAQRKKVKSRAAELIAEEIILRELRKARKLTQVRMAKALGEDEAVDLLDTNLKEEKEALRQVEKIATRVSNEAAKTAA